MSKAVVASNFFRNLLRSLFFVVIFPVTLVAERTAKSVFIEAPGDAPKKVFLVALEEDAIEVPLPTRAFSPEIELPNGDLVFAVLPRPLAEDEEIPAEAPKVRIPKDWTHCYLLFTFEKTNKVFPVKVIVIDGSANEFPLGHTRIVNLSEARVRGKFGEQILNIEPKKIKTLEPQRKDRGAFPVAIDYLEKGAEKSRPLTRTNWQHDPRSRKVLLITKPAGVKFPRIRGIQDRVRPKKK